MNRISFLGQSVLFRIPQCPQRIHSQPSWSLRHFNPFPPRPCLLPHLHLISGRGLSADLLFQASVRTTIAPPAPLGVYMAECSNRERGCFEVLRKVYALVLPLSWVTPLLIMSQPGHLTPERDYRVILLLKRPRTVSQIALPSFPLPPQF